MGVCEKICILVFGCFWMFFLQNDGTVILTIENYTLNKKRKRHVKFVLIQCILSEVRSYVKWVKNASSKDSYTNKFDV